MDGDPTAASETKVPDSLLQWARARPRSWLARPFACGFREQASVLWRVLVATILCGSIFFLIASLASQPCGNPRDIKVELDVKGVTRSGERLSIALPSPTRSREVSELLDAGWVIQDPRPDDASTAPTYGHRLLLNGTELPMRHVPQRYGMSRGTTAGSYCFVRKAWAGGPWSIAIFIPPSPDTPIESLSVVWRLVDPSVTQPVFEVPSWAQLASIAGFALATAVIVAALGKSKSASAWVMPLLTAFPCGTCIGVLLLARIDLTDGTWVQTACRWTASSFQAAVALVAIASVVARLLRRDLARNITASAPISIGLATIATLLCILFATWSSSRPIWDWTSSEYALLLGRIPFNDASGWFGGAVTLPNGELLNEFTARRPVYVALRAGEWLLAGKNYQISLCIHALLCAGGIVGLVMTIWRFFGPASALLSWSGLTWYSAGTIGSYQSECLGLTCACVSAALLIRGVCTGRLHPSLWGAFFMGIAWLVRPGPVGLLAAPLLVTLLAAHSRWSRRVAGTVAVATSLAIPLVGATVLHAWAAKPGTLQNDNGSHTVLGLATGTSWKEANTRFLAADPERAKLSAKELAELRYMAAARAVVENPLPALKLAWQNLEGGTKWLFITMPASAWLPWVSPSVAKVTLWLCVGLALIRMALWIRTQPQLAVCTGVPALVGTLSLPLIWGDGGVRGVAMLAPFALIWLSSCVAFDRRKASDSNAALDAGPGEWLPSALTATAVLTCGLVGVVAFATNRATERRPATDITIRLTHDPAVLVSDTSSPRGLWGPPACSRAEALAVTQGFTALHKSLETAILPALVTTPTGFGAAYLIEGFAPSDLHKQIVVISRIRNPHGVWQVTEWKWID
jgi:hypothetical protein